MVNAMLEISNLTKNFGGLMAVSHLSFQVKEGKTFGIIGPNGAGKTTILKLIAGFERPSQGRILFKGAEIQGMRPDLICRKGIARTFQIPQVFPSMTVLENVLIGSFIPESGRVSKSREKALQVLDFLGLGEKKDLNCQSLTIADLKRLEIAKALATDPTCILLDEVVAGLTRVETEELIHQIEKRLKNRGLTIILVEHVMQAVAYLCDSVLVLHHGEKIAQGTPPEVMRDEKVIKSYLGEDFLA